MARMTIRVHEGKKEDIETLRKEWTDLWYKFHGAAGMGPFTLADFARAKEIQDDAKFAGALGSKLYKSICDWFANLSLYDYEKLFGVQSWK